MANKITYGFTVRCARTHNLLASGSGYPTKEAAKREGLHYGAGYATDGEPCELRITRSKPPSPPRVGRG